MKEGRPRFGRAIFLVPSIPTLEEFEVGVLKCEGFAHLVVFDLVPSRFRSFKNVEMMGHANKLKKFIVWCTLSYFLNSEVRTYR